MKKSELVAIIAEKAELKKVDAEKALNAFVDAVTEGLVKGEKIATDWCEGFEVGSVKLTDINEAVAAKGTKEAIEDAKAKLIAGEIKVFDTANFTVEGKNLDSYKADVDTDEAYTPDTEVISEGYFHESEYRSAPYFDLQIDGITLLNSAF